MSYLNGRERAPAEDGEAESLMVSLTVAASVTKKRGLPESLQQRSPSRCVSRDPLEDASPSHVGSEVF